MREFLRLALPALLGAALGCSRPVRTAQDGGRPSLASERREPRADPPEGSIEGRVLWVGPRPAPARLATNASVQRVCGPSVADNALQLDGQGGVADVVVWVDAKAAPAPAGEGQVVVLDQVGCLYQPPILAARAGGPLRLRNSDPLTHTVHAVGLGRSLFNVAMPLQNAELTRQLPPEPMVVNIGCDVHPWMVAVVRTFDHPHFTTSGADGRFRLPGLARGATDVHAWHPRLGEVSARVQVTEGVTGADFTFGGTR